jgi:hypothetical protein
MPTVRTHPNGNIILKDNKVSCECCTADLPIGCSATAMDPTADVVVNITRAQALALKTSFGVRCTFFLQIASWQIVYNTVGFPYTVTCPAINLNAISQTVFNTVCNAGSNFGQIFLGDYATGTTIFSGSLRDVLGGIGMSFFLRQLGTSLNQYQLGFRLSNIAVDAQWQGSRAGIALSPQGTFELRGPDAQFTGLCMGQPFSFQKSYFANVYFNPNTIVSSSGGFIQALNMNVTNVSPP